MYVACVHLIPSRLEYSGNLSSFDLRGEKESAGSGIQLSLTDVRLFLDILHTTDVIAIDVFVHQ